MEEVPLNLNLNFKLPTIFMPKLKFAANPANEDKGLSDARIEKYRDEPFPAVARETDQNSRDAQKNHQPLQIEFKEKKDRFESVGGGSDITFKL